MKYEDTASWHWGEHGYKFAQQIPHKFCIQTWVSTLMEFTWYATCTRPHVRPLPRATYHATTTQSRKCDDCNASNMITTKTPKCHSTLLGRTAQIYIKLCSAAPAIIIVKLQLLLEVNYNCGKVWLKTESFGLTEYTTRKNIFILEWQIEERQN